MRPWCWSALCVVWLLLLTLSAKGQVTTGAILGVVRDVSGATVADAQVEVRRLDTNTTLEDWSDLQGRFRFLALPIGSYELTANKTGFSQYNRGPIVLRLNQEAELEVTLAVARLSEKVTVTADAPLINTRNAEVGVNFDSKRVSGLPLTPSRYVLNLALSVAGVSPVHDGQRITGFLPGSVPISVNGMRVRSNNMMIDGQDSTGTLQNEPSQPINNPDIVGEFRLLTSQFAPEYGQAAGSVINLITKAGSNQFHGSAFWFHNDNHLNARSNLDKLLVASSPFRAENQFGGTLGGPVLKDKTFFFGSLQRWTDRRFRGGTSFQGAPTVEGRALLDSLVGDRSTVKILLEHLPPAQAPVPGLSKPLRVEGGTVDIPLGTLSGTNNIRFNDWQWSARVDHRLNDRHTIGGRYLFDDRINSGDGQSVPPGLTDVLTSRSQSASAFLNSTPSTTVFHELRLSYKRSVSKSDGANPAAGLIPSIEVPDLGLTLFQSGPNRTAIGLATNLPMQNFASSYQLQDTWAVLRSAHLMKAGLDVRQQNLSTFFPLNSRGRLSYSSLQDLVDDVAQVALINSPLAGNELFQHYHYRDYSFFLQDQWRIGPSFAVTYGIRYEAPGNPFETLHEVNRRIVAAAGGDLRFAAGALPERDINNWAPRFGFNYHFARGNGILGHITGDGKLVMRGGYSRTYDQVFLNIVRSVANGFPFVRSDRLAARTPNSLERLQTLSAAPIGGDPNQQSRQPVAPDFRSPVAEQFALQLQRELSNNWALTIGYVGTKGTALFELVDGNPTVPGAGGRRVDPNRGTISLRCNCASSIFHSMQTSLEKRLSSNFSIAAHYTWSTFIDGASDAFSMSNGDVGIAQDSFNRRAERGRSTFDRPHRFVLNGVFELPFQKAQKGRSGKILGGWQFSGFLTVQSGAPFVALDGADPGNRLGGIVSSVRANVSSPLDLARLPVEQILQAGGARLFSRVTATDPLGNLGRNILRSDGIGNLDFGFLKNTKLREEHILQFRAEFYNTTNSRDFGVPESRLSSPNFLNQWGLDGGNRRIVMAIRYVF